MALRNQPHLEGALGGPRNHGDEMFILFHDAPLESLLEIGQRAQQAAPVIPVVSHHADLADPRLGRDRRGGDHLSVRVQEAVPGVRPPVAEQEDAGGAGFLGGRHETLMIDLDHVLHLANREVGKIAVMGPGLDDHLLGPQCGHRGGDDHRDVGAEREGLPHPGRALSSLTPLEGGIAVAHDPDAPSAPVRSAPLLQDGRELLLVSRAERAIGGVRRTGLALAAGPCERAIRPAGCDGNPAPG